MNVVRDETESRKSELADCEVVSVGRLEPSRCQRDDGGRWRDDLQLPRDNPEEAVAADEDEQLARGVGAGRSPEDMGDKYGTDDVRERGGQGEDKREYPLKGLEEKGDRVGRESTANP